MEEKIINKHIRTIAGQRPILLEMPHSGLAGLDPEQIPYPLRSGINPGEGLKKAIGTGCDSSVPEMTSFNNLLRELDLYGISNDLARILCDTNREKKQISDLVAATGVPNDHHHGIIWASAPLINMDLSLPNRQLQELLVNKAEKLYKKPLTYRKFEALMKEIYDPYHSWIDYVHEKMVLRHGFCIHLALHSMPPFAPKKICGAYVFGPKAKRGPFDPANNTLPDVILIHNNFKAAGRNFVEELKHTFRKSGLIAEDGVGPFLGDIGVTRKYGNPLRGINIIGIEHVAHDTEPGRHLGDPTVDIEKARQFQSVYREAISRLL